jgi:hypothetical protein
VATASSDAGAGAVLSAVAQVFLQVTAPSKEELRTEVGLLIGQDPDKKNKAPVSVMVNGIETFAEVSMCVINDKKAIVSLTITEVEL